MTEIAQKPSKTKDKPLKTIAQMSGFSRLPAGGGWRLSIDLFEANEVEIAAMALLVNHDEIVDITIEPHEEE